MGLSDKILERKKKRRNKQFIVIGLCVFFALNSFGVYWQWKKEHTIVNASWTGFQMSSQGIGGKGQWESVSGLKSDGIPYVVQIDGENWALVKVNHFDDSNESHAGRIQAMTNCEHRTISYIPADNPIVMHANIMHEVFHAGACLHGGDAWWNSGTGTPDHPGIYHLGEFTAAFLHDNPELMEWLRQ